MQNDWACVAATASRFLAVNREAAHDAGVWTTLGNALQYCGDSELGRAERAYRRALQLEAAPVAHFNLAGLLARQHRFKEAAAEYQAAERAGMSSEELYLDWAAAQKQDGNIEADRQTAARGLERFPESTALKAIARGSRN